MLENPSVLRNIISSKLSVDNGSPWWVDWSDWVESQDLLDERLEIWTIQLISSLDEAILPNNTVQLFLKLLLNFGVCAHISKNPLDEGNESIRGRYHCVHQSSCKFWI